MANLETLELTISANAESATQGIASLTASLSSLSKAVSKSVGDLIKLNAELSKLKSFGALKLPNISQSTGAARAAKAGKATGIYDPATNNNRIAVNRASPNAKPDDQWEREYQANLAADRARHQETIERNRRYREAIAQAEARKAFKEDNRPLAQNSVAIKDLAKNMYHYSQAASDASKQGRSFKESLSAVREGASKLTGGVTHLFSRVKRIATTMLIRAAIRGLIRSIKEGVSNFKEWSKLNGKEFADSVDQMKAKAQELKNSIGASIAPVIQAAIPVINALANAAIYAFNWVNQLIALLTGKSSWTQATANADAYADSAKKAGGAAKSWLASFDELNVMSQGGGGGGGGTAAEFENMFQEVFSFDSKIREIANFLKENAESIKDMMIAAGVAIASWKFATAFGNALPLLAAIAGVIGTAATIAITLQANWMLTNEYLNTGKPGWLIAGALTTALGSTIAWTMAEKIIGGGAGYFAASITLALAAYSDIKANVKATNVDAFSKQSIWTSIKAALEGGAAAGVFLAGAGATTAGILTGAAGAALFTFAVAMGLKLFAQRDQIEWGEIHLSDEEVQEFVNQRMFNVDIHAAMNIISEQIDVNESERQKIQDILQGAMGTWHIIQLGLADNQDYGLMQSQIEGLIDELGGYIENAKATGKLTLQYTPTLVGDDDVTQGKWFTEYNQGWDQVEAFIKQKGSLIGQWLTEQEKKEIKDSVPDVVAAAMQQIADVSNAIAQAKVNAKAFSAFQLSLVDLDEASFKDVISKFNEFKSDLTKEYEALVKEQYENQAALVAALAITVGENDPQYKEAVAALNTMGENMAKAVKDGVSSAATPAVELIREWFLKKKGGISATWDVKYWSQYFREEGLTPENLQQAVQSIIVKLEPETIELMQLLGVSGFEFFDEKLQKDILDTVGVKPDTIAALKAIEVPIDTLINVVDFDKLKDSERKKLVTALINAYGSSEAINAIKKVMPNLSAVDLVKMVNWGSLTDKVRFDLINSMKDVFGATATLDALKSVGVNVSTFVERGLKSADPTIKSMAQEWSKILQDNIQPQLKVSVTADNAGINSLCSTLSSKIKAALNQKVTIKVGTSTVSNMQIKAETKASGGLVSSGDLFIANENGVPEMIGRFGNQAGVANQGQIIAGIQQGVADANREQNTLLREQNNLLRGILAKEGNVRIGASAALGRTVSQSIAMYNGVAGG